METFCTKMETFCTKMETFENPWGGGGGHNFATNFFSKCFSEMVGIVLVITYKWEASDPLQKIGFPRSEMTWKHFVKNGNILYKNGNI